MAKLPQTLIKELAHGVELSFKANWVPKPMSLYDLSQFIELISDLTFFLCFS